MANRTTGGTSGGNRTSGSSRGMAAKRSARRQRERNAAVQAARMGAAQGGRSRRGGMSRREYRLQRQRQRLEARGARRAERQYGRTERTFARREASVVRNQGKADSGYWSPEAVSYRQQSMQTMYGEIPAWLAAAGGLIDSARTPRDQLGEIRMAQQDAQGGEIVPFDPSMGQPQRPAQGGSSVQGLLLPALLIGGAYLILS